jgi:hypothetical protein
MKFVYGASLALALASCQSTAERPPIAFDAKAAEFIQHEGAGRIDGHAFYRSDTGRVIFAAGENVWLIPRTPYTDRRFAQLYGSEKYSRARWLPSVEADPDYVKYTRSTKAESNGRFTFDHVGPGEYYVATSVTWRPAGSFVMSGGAIYERVAMTGKEKEPVKVIVSGK